MGEDSSYDCSDHPTEGSELSRAYSQPSIARPIEPLRTIAVLKPEPDELERSGIRFHPTAHDGLDTARAALIELPDGRQFGLLRYDHNPAPGTELLSPESSTDIAADVAAAVAALGLSEDTVTWTLDPAASGFARSLEPRIFLELNNPFSNLREGIKRLARSISQRIGEDAVGVVSRKELAYGVSPVDVIYVWPRDQSEDDELTAAIDEIIEWGEDTWARHRRQHPDEVPRPIEIVRLTADGRAMRAVRIDAPTGKAHASTYDETGLPPRPRPEWHGWET